MTKPKLKILPEIAKALKNKRPVVALETTIISHGLPYPDNIDCALTLEKTIRERGAIPATLAVIDGVINIGITEKELKILAIKDENKSIYKISRADLPFIISNKLTGATTVAGTMILAKLAGIKFFATGGIGGVHRFAEKTFDISADLEELAKTDVTVISAGAKAILDIPKTLEYLETKGVPIIGYKTSTFPLFYTSESKYQLNLRADSPEAIADFLKIKEQLGYTCGALIANPVDKSKELSNSYIDAKIKKALNLANKKNIIGKAVTPFLLETLYKLTEGKSLETNLALVINNAKLAADISVAFFK